MSDDPKPTAREGKRNEPPERLSPSSQIGRLARTGNTPEARRAADREQGSDSKRWRQPEEEHGPVEDTTTQPAGRDE